jgi:hypothetical protein
MTQENMKASDLTVEALVAVWGGFVQKLVDQGVPAGRVAESLWIAGSRAETLHASDPMKKLAAAAERLRLHAEAELRGEEGAPSADEPTPIEEGGYTGPERRGPGRPWQRAG